VKVAPFLAENGTKNENPGPTSSQEKRTMATADDDIFSDGPACFRNRFNGTYKSFNRGDIVIPSNEWIFIHKGRCRCEGQSPPDCNEPGDDT
jgi:hypothetical protein